MEQSTQTNRTDIEYISIYDKQKKLGRPAQLNFQMKKEKSDQG